MKIRTLPLASLQLSTGRNVKRCNCLSKCIFHMLTNACYDPHMVITGKWRWYQPPSLHDSLPVLSDYFEYYLPKENRRSKPFCYTCKRIQWCCIFTKYIALEGIILLAVIQAEVLLLAHTEWLERLQCVLLLSSGSEALEFSDGQDLVLPSSYRPPSTSTHSSGTKWNFISSKKFPPS